MKKYNLFIFILTGLMSAAGFAVEPVRIVLMGWSVNYHDSPLSEIPFDLRSLQRFQMLNADGQTQNLYDLNQSIRRKVNQNFGRDGVDLSRFARAPNLESFGLDNFNRGYFRRLTLQAQSAVSGNTATLIASPPVPGAQLFNIPRPEDTGELTPKQVDVFSSLVYRKQLSDYYFAAGRILRARQVQLVLLPSNQTAREIYRRLRIQGTIATRRDKEADLWQIAKQRAEIDLQALRAFVTENPQTIFVMGLGNNDEQILEENPNPGTLNLKNLIKVAAFRLDPRDKFDPPSNFSPDFADIAVGVVSHESWIPEGTSATQPGTGTAAAHLINILAQILERSSNLSPVAAIQILNDRFAHSDARFAGSVRQSLVLDEPAAWKQLAFMRERGLIFVQDPQTQDSYILDPEEIADHAGVESCAAI